MIICSTVVFFYVFFYYVVCESSLNTCPNIVVQHSNLVSREVPPHTCFHYQHIPRKILVGITNYI